MLVLVDNFEEAGPSLLSSQFKFLDLHNKSSNIIACSSFWALSNHLPSSCPIAQNADDFAVQNVLKGHQFSDEQVS